MKTAAYCFQKLLGILITMFLVTVLTFLAFNLIPGDPAQLILGTEATPQSLAELHARLGLDKSLPVRYLSWLGGLLSGDMGISLQYSKPVSPLIFERLPVTAWLAGLALVFILLLSFPAGVLSAKSSRSFLGRLLDSLTVLNLALPNFFIGILCIWVLGLVLHIFTPGAYVDYRQNFQGFLRYLIFPALAIALPNAAVIAKFLRTSILAEKNSGYVATAKSKGLSDNAILLKHVLKNALIPAITLFGMIIAEVFSGSILIEQVYSLPGIGRLLISAVNSRDFPLMESLVVYIAFLVTVANFAADLLKRAADPRMKSEP
ncbi:MAG: Dipeptide transport system permease protein dppB [Thermocaproicibacter melissae]|jgi:peptide/nickel transport system permease protein|uniref:ABC transporter permease n=1 Tax=Thermocaproicibacter melissae TaxID=2966552 RepID=UPI003A0FF1D6